MFLQSVCWYWHHGISELVLDVLLSFKDKTGKRWSGQPGAVYTETALPLLMFSSNRSSYLPVEGKNQATEKCTSEVCYLTYQPWRSPFWQLLSVTVSQWASVGSSFSLSIFCSILLLAWCGRGLQWWQGKGWELASAAGWPLLHGMTSA